MWSIRSPRRGQPFGWWSEDDVIPRLPISSSSGICWNTRMFFFFFFVNLSLLYPHDRETNRVILKHRESIENPNPPVLNSNLPSKSSNPSFPDGMYFQWIERLHTLDTFDVPNKYPPAASYDNWHANASCRHWLDRSRWSKVYINQSISHRNNRHAELYAENLREKETRFLRKTGESDLPFRLYWCS